MDRASRRFCHPLHMDGVGYGDMATWPSAGKGLPLQGNVFAVTWEGKWQRVWCLVDRAGRGPSRPKPHTCGDPRRRPAWAKARQGSADFVKQCLLQFGPPSKWLTSARVWSVSSSPGKGLAHLASFYVPAERCSRKRVCHKLLLPGAVAGELSKAQPKTPTQQKRHDNYTPAFLAVVFKLQF